MASQMYINSLNLGFNFKLGFEIFKPRSENFKPRLEIIQSAQLHVFFKPGLKRSNYSFN